MGGTPEATPWASDVGCDPGLKRWRDLLTPDEAGITRKKGREGNPEGCEESYVEKVRVEKL